MNTGEEGRSALISSHRLLRALPRSTVAWLWLETWLWYHIAPSEWPGAVQSLGSIRSGEVLVQRRALPCVGCSQC